MEWQNYLFDTRKVMNYGSVTRTILIGQQTLHLELDHYGNKKFLIRMQQKLMICDSVKRKILIGQQTLKLKLGQYGGQNHLC